MTDKTDKPEEKKPEEMNNDEKKEGIKGEEVVVVEEECKKCEEYKAKYLRAMADYQNLERRVQDQRIEWIKIANKNVVLKLLTFLDDLERAEAFVKDVNLAHVKDSFDKMLKSEGLEEIEVLNKPYDPYTAEVIDMKEGEEDGMVVAVLRKGYTYNGQLLRVAQVTVSKKVEKKV